MKLLLINRGFTFGLCCFSLAAGMFAAGCSDDPKPAASGGVCVDGEKDTRVRYQPASGTAKADGVALTSADCNQETQTRTCSGGQWGEWSGTFTLVQCQVPAKKSCDGKAHGATDNRVRFKVASVIGGEKCESETQSRVCDDGKWGEWTGSFKEPACGAQVNEDCGILENGKSETRVRYENKEVPFGTKCKVEEQKRTCESGKLSEWSGTFKAEECRPKDAASCDKSHPHGSTDTRIVFESATVPADGQCKQETQTRACNNGAWSKWSGAFEQPKCEVLGHPSCGESPHGKPEARVRFEKEYVVFGQECKAEQQTRTCADGNWSEWTGTFSKPTCQKLSPEICVGTSQESRTRFEKDSVPFGEECKEESQRRDCTPEGLWTQWTGTFTNTQCQVQQAAPCVIGDNGSKIEHGQTEVRNRYETGSVPYGSTCAKEQQVRTCNNGTMTEWTGSFAHEYCKVDGVKSCGETPHGEQKSQIRYEKAIAEFGEQCKSEEQVSVCNNGEWTAWTGSYSAESCIVKPEASCDGSTVQTRTRYENPVVSTGAECKHEVQTRVCANGTWGAWSGTYTAKGCIVE